MPFLIDNQREWLKTHGRRDEGGGWVCRETGKPINAKPFRQTLYAGCCSLEQHLTALEAPQDSGGEARTVLMLWCTGCGQEPKELDTGNSAVVEVAA